MPEIVRSVEPVTLAGAGEMGEHDLDLCLKHAPRLVAADGGAVMCLACGQVPEAVIGDMDSLDRAVQAGLPPERIHRIDEQESTDFDKALRHIAAPLVLGVGFTGARMDHFLAAFNVLVRNPGRRCILLGAQDLVFLGPPLFRMAPQVGTRLSLYPMGAVEGFSEGLQWPIAGLTFTPDGRVGTSNRVTGPVEIGFTAPKMLVMLPRDSLGLAVRALAEQPGSWPVP
ncbi:thiamine diphosphokinase [Salinihabitans flavidus]|uniref:Thiamine diphosphokinase n=1 Tax=Salinihabitans flavidus TaxID=569882 RepID=A0A1H8MFK9_9RHOB|nr:thiamine diphosphokinase [Salinihabitans flavidus]SEO16192.1 thiamine diphosphokinase [Salinihabitans flavidus]